MKQIRQFGWMLALLTAVLLTTLMGRQGDAIGQKPGSELPQKAVAAVMTPQDTRHHEATLTDASNLLRICSSRPQRVLPSQGSKTERTIHTGGAARRNIVKPLHNLHDSRRRLETAPFCMSASCDYYVIALRRIIR